MRPGHCAGSDYSRIIPRLLRSWQFDVKDANWSSSVRVAIVAKRSDREALSEDLLFVLIGDHVFSPTELRAAYYGHHAILDADGNERGE